MGIPARFRAALVTAVLVSCAACHKASNVGAYRAAINTYYAAHPDCLWPAAQKFPLQVDFSDHVQTFVLETLVGRGLLEHTWGSRRDPVLGNVPTLTYKVKDRSQFTPDPTEANAGNFCYGHRVVDSIDKTEGGLAMLPETARVEYHFNMVGVPAWANAPETQKAIPSVKLAVRGVAADVATLVHSSDNPANSGWSVVPPPVHKVQ